MSSSLKERVAELTAHLHSLVEEEGGKYSHINFFPPEGVAKAAARGLELRREYGRGGTAIGIARARDLKNRKELSPETVRRMRKYFLRHQGDNLHEKNPPSNGWIAWLLWGGNSGWAWANKVVRQMDSADNKD